MGEITRLAAVAGKAIVRVHIDGRFWASLPLGVVADEGLHVGEDLSQARREDLEHQGLAERALGFAIKSLDFRMASRAQLGERLARQGFPEATVTLTLERLAALGVLDDYALALTRSRRLAEAGYAQGSARQRLRRQGFGDADIARAIEEAYVEFEPAAVARRVLSARPSIAANHRRAYAFLARRGFDPKVAGQIAAELAPPAASPSRRTGQSAATGASDARTRRTPTPFDPAELERQVRRRYPTAGSDVSAARRAHAYCVRHGATATQAQTLLRALRSE